LKVLVTLGSICCLKHNQNGSLSLTFEPNSLNSTQTFQNVHSIDHRTRSFLWHEVMEEVVVGTIGISMEN